MVHSAPGDAIKRENPEQMGRGFNKKKSS